MGGQIDSLWAKESEIRSLKIISPPKSLSNNSLLFLSERLVGVVADTHEATRSWAAGIRRSSYSVTTKYATSKYSMEADREQRRTRDERDAQDEPHAAPGHLGVGHSSQPLGHD